MRLFILLSFLPFISIRAQSLYDYYASMASQKIELNDFEGAEYFINKGIERYPDSIQFYLQAGSNYYFLKQFGKSVINFSKAIDMGYNDPLVFRNRGASLHMMGKLDSAAIDYNHYLDYFPNDKIMHLKIGLLELNRGNLETAKQHVIPYYNQVPNISSGYLTLGEVYQLQEDYDSSIVVYSELIKTDSTNIQGYIGRAKSYEYLQEHEKRCADLLSAFQLGAYEVKKIFDNSGCYEILKMDNKNSPFIYPPPPPEIIIEEVIRE